MDQEASSVGIIQVFPDVSRTSENSDETELRTSDQFRPSLYFKLEDNVLDGLLGQTMLTSNIAAIVPERIIIRRDHRSMTGRVKLLSGGCAGHDPLFAGFVGRGMLTAAVYGDETGGPTPKQILTALRELKTSLGIIIITKNDLNERLNFGLAMERARSEGIVVDMIAVGDDCWEHQESSTGRRCLSGIIAVIKVAGAMSEAKKSMKDIFIMCRAMIQTSLSTVFPVDSFTRFGTDIKGIGGRNMGDMTAYESVREMVHYMFDSNKYLSTSVFPLNKFIVILNCYNNDQLLLGTLTKEILQQLRSVNICVERMFSGSFIKGPYPGYCFTLVKDIEKELLCWFDAPISSKIWPENITQRPAIMNLTIGNYVSDVPPVGCRVPLVKGPRSNVQFRCYGPECINSACNVLISSEIMLNRMDPEGYYGTKMARAAKTILEGLEYKEMNFGRPFHLMNKISTIMEESVVGATGVMYGLLFSGIAQSFLSYVEHVEVKFDHWVDAIKKGINTLASMTRIKIDDCTLIDALYPFYQGLINSKERGTVECIKNGVEGAEAGAQLTVMLKSSRHMPNLPEPGAQAVATVTRAIFETIKSIELRNSQLKDKFIDIPCPIGIVESNETPPPTSKLIEEDDVITIDAEEDESKSVSDIIEDYEMIEKVEEEESY